MPSKCEKNKVRVGNRCVSDNDYHDAIVAKNHIARHLGRNRYGYKKPIDGDEFIIERLKEIEKVLGTGNQPSVEDSFETDWKY